MRSEVAGRARHLDLLLVSLALAAAFAVHLANRAGIVGLFNDDSVYAVAAGLIAGGSDPLRADLTGYPPLDRFPIGFPALLAALRLWAGSDLAAVPAWEIAVALSACAFLFESYALLTRAWAVTKPIAVLAVALVAFHPLTIKYAAAVMSDFPAAAVAVGALGLAEWARRRRGARLPVALAGAVFGAAVLLRYASAPAAVAAFLVLWTDGRRRAAAGLAATAAAVVAPWGVWVATHHAWGYGAQYATQDAGRTYLESLWASTVWLALQSLPGLLLPLPFLTGLERQFTPLPPPPGPLALAALGLSALLAGAAGAALARPERRMPALYGLLTVALVWVWCGRFPELVWDLQVRLLLPVAPVLVAFALAWLAGAAAVRPGRVLYRLLGALALAWIARSDYALGREQIARSASLTEHLRGLLAAKAYLDRVPPDVRVGTLYPFQGYFYCRRPFEAALPSVAGLEDARERGIRLLLAMPYLQRGHDRMWRAIDTLRRQEPPGARVLYVATDHLAVVHLPGAGPVKPEDLPGRIPARK